MPTVTPGAIVPAVPYPAPVPPPVGLGVSRVTVTIDQAWLPYVIGACKVLTANSTFDPPDPAPAIAAIKSAYDLLDDLAAAVPFNPNAGSGCCDCDCCGDCMQLRFNNCVLQQFDCVTQMWVDVPTTGNCNPNPAPGGGQTPPTAGGCQEYTMQFLASALTPLPFLVNTGDTIQINSLHGAGSDSGPTWFCPDGSIFIAGACAGGSFLVSTDPLPTSAHMSVLLKIGSTYYPFSSGTFTVPSGVTNQSVYIGVNDTTIGDDPGQYSLDMKYCNNQSPPPTAWCFDQALPSSPHSWMQRAVSGIPICGGSFTGLVGIWTSGAGLQGTQFQLNNCVDSFAIGDMSLDLGVNANFTVQFTFNLSIAQGGSDSFQIYAATSAAGAGAVLLSSSTGLSAGSHVISATSTSNLRFVLFNMLLGDYVGSGSGVQFTISDIKFTGTGVNPFGSSNC